MLLRHRFLPLLSFLLVGLALAQGESEGFRFFTPTVYNARMQILVSGKRRDYCVLDEGRQIEIKVQGPSQLKVLSRAILTSATDSIQYTYLALRKGSRKTMTFSHRTHASDKAGFVGSAEGAISVSRIKIVDVPRGEHVYTFYLPKNFGRRLLMRFALNTNAFTNGTPVVAMTPEEFTTEVGLATGEEVSSYYRVGTGQHVALNLIGPATLKVMARIEYAANMTGQQKWKVQVTEDGRVKGTYSLASVKSEVTTYREPSPLVASRAELFYVEIPAGEHRYEFTMPENHRTTLLKFLLPKSQLERK
jgi:hypothetical protein